MQAITFPAVVSAEDVNKTVLDMAWRLLDKRALTLTSFVEMIALNAPDHGDAALFNEAISQSLTHEAIRLAQALAERGLEQYPGDEGLRNAQKALAPPKVISQTPSTRNHSKTMRWLSAHSHEYVGKWIAIQDGVLLGTSESRKALVEHLGALAEQDDVMMVRVPVT